MSPIWLVVETTEIIWSDLYIFSVVSATEKNAKRYETKQCIMGKGLNFNRMFMDVPSVSIKFQ